MSQQKRKWKQWVGIKQRDKKAPLNSEWGYF